MNRRKDIQQCLENTAGGESAVNAHEKNTSRCWRSGADPQIFPAHLPLAAELSAGFAKNLPENRHGRRCWCCWCCYCHHHHRRWGVWFGSTRSSPSRGARECWCCADIGLSRRSPRRQRERAVTGVHAAQRKKNKHNPAVSRRDTASLFETNCSNDRSMRHG